MKEQKIEFKEIDSTHLGTDKECKTPTEKAKEDKASPKATSIGKS